MLGNIAVALRCKGYGKQPCRGWKGRGSQALQDDLGIVRAEAETMEGFMETPAILDTGRTATVDGPLEPTVREGIGWRGGKRRWEEREERGEKERERKREEK